MVGSEIVIVVVECSNIFKGEGGEFVMALHVAEMEQKQRIGRRVRDVLFDNGYVEMEEEDVVRGVDYIEAVCLVSVVEDRFRVDISNDDFSEFFDERSGEVRVNSLIGYLVERGDVSFLD